MSIPSPTSIDVRYESDDDFAFPLAFPTPLDETHLLMDPIGPVNYPLHADSEISEGDWIDIYDTPTGRRLYDVFLSFRGEDTRASFTSHLHASLQNSGIIVFRDDDSLRRGDQISTSLVRAIEESRIAVVVFSRNYAGSKWCMNELDKIMECYRTIGLLVLPVFYDVDPSQVRHQTCEFGDAFQKLLNRISIKEDEFRWRRVLREAGGLAGIVVLNSR